MPAALRGSDPVVYLEPIRLYRAAREKMEDDGEDLPVDRCFALREGNDVTLVARGAKVVEALQAVSDWDAKGFSAEVIDVATLKPLDGPLITPRVRPNCSRQPIIGGGPGSGPVSSPVHARE